MRQWDESLQTDDWITEGAEVAMIQYLGFRNVPNVSRAVIKKVGKRDVHVGNRKFSKKLRSVHGRLRGGLRETGSGHYGHSMMLVPVTHPEVVAEERREEIYNRESEIERLFNRWKRHADDREALIALHSEISEYLELTAPE